jgi:hypothetical protein
MGMMAENPKLGAPVGPPGVSPRERYLKRYSALKQKRNGFDAHWQELGQNFRPRRPRFFSSDTQKAATIRNDNIRNNTPLQAGRTLGAGMQDGITSPARPWFELDIPTLREKSSLVTQWLADVTEELRLIIQRSNIYTALQSFYMDLADFGTAVLWIDEDDTDVVRGYTLPVGSYCLATSARSQIDTLYRFVPMTISQMVEWFGDKCSETVKVKHANGNLDDSVNVIHVVEPNTDYETKYADKAGMKYRSVWFEETGDATVTGFLRESGYRECPFLATRWDSTSDDVYGFGPGMDALGDSKMLQELESDSLTQVQKATDPPLAASSRLKGQAISMIPGKVTYVDDEGGNGVERLLRPIHTVDYNAITVTENKIRQVEGRINRTYFVDLFLMLSNMNDKPATMTAREVAERHTEKMAMLGPVLERLNDELLDPMIDRIFACAERRGLLPIPPEEIQGLDYKPKYTSILAQAQRLIGAAAVERFVGFVGSLAGAVPEALDNVDFDAGIRQMAQVLGVRPELVRSKEQVSQIRAQRAKVQQQQMQAEQATQAATAAKTLADTNLSEDNALTTLARNTGWGGSSLLAA